MIKLQLNVIYFSSFDGATPVHIAAAWGKQEELDMLLSRGGDPMIKDNEGQTALDYAKTENQEVYLKLKSYQGTIYPELEDVQKYTYELGAF
jgi:ankyrin repeat protein